MQTFDDSAQKAAEAQLAELRATLQREQATQKLLDHQLRQGDDDVRGAQRLLDTCRDDQTRMSDQLRDLQLYVTLFFGHGFLLDINVKKKIKRFLKSTQDQISKVQRSKEDLLVEENLLRLEIRRLRQALSHKADSVLSLGQRKLQLETAMKVRVGCFEYSVSQPANNAMFVGANGRDWDASGAAARRA
jgi:hypothetical protein